MKQELETSDIVLNRLILGYGLSQAIYVAAKLGIPDLLVGGPKDGDDLARATTTNTQSLSRVLRLLAANGVLEEVATDRFALAPMGELLRSDAEASQRPYAILTMELEYPAWGQLLHAVRTGQPGFVRAFGQPLWEYLAINREAAAVFDAAMVGVTRWQAQTVVEAYDFSGSVNVVDVGGGHGTLLASILRAYPDARGVLFDRPQVMEGARAFLEAAAVADRCSLVEGDFLESIPAGGGTYLLKWIVHDWDDARATTILRNCKQAMGARGKVLLVEGVIPDGTASAQHAQGLWDDVLMMVLLGGRERTTEQYERLLGAAGLHVGAIVPVGPGLCVIEGHPRDSRHSLS
jgi:predicted O-methyltransferase YrrM